MISGSRGSTNYFSRSQEEWEELALSVAKTHNSAQPLIQEAIEEAFEVDNSGGTLSAVADKIDVCVWTFGRLWDVLSNLVANRTNSGAPNPKSSWEHSVYQNPVHPDQGMTPVGDVFLAAGAGALLIGLAQRIYQLHRERERNSYEYVLRHLNEMSIQYKEINLKFADTENAYQTFTKADLINGFNEILKRSSFNPSAQSNDDLPSPYNDYFEPSEFVKKFNQFTATTPVQYLENAWNFLNVQSLWFWIMWFPFYLASGAALSVVMPTILITTGVISGLHLLHKISSFIYKKVTGKDDSEARKTEQAEFELLIKKLKIQYYIDQEHRKILKNLKNKYGADIGTYDICLVPAGDFTDNFDEVRSFKYTEILDEYLSAKYFNSLDEITDEDVVMGKLYLQKINRLNKYGISESCIAYLVKSPTGEIVRDFIPNNIIQPPEPFSRHQLNLIKSEILDYTGGQDHTFGKNIDIFKELNHLDHVDPIQKTPQYQIDTHRTELITIKKNNDPNPEKPVVSNMPKERVPLPPDVVLSSTLAKHLLGSEAERNAFAAIATLRKGTSGFIFTTFILWFAASLAGVFPLAVGAASFLSSPGLASLAIGLGGLLGLDRYCEIRGEQAAYKKKVYQTLSEYLPLHGVTRLERFNRVEQRVEIKKDKVIKLRNQLKVLNKDDDKSLMSDCDLKKINVYKKDYYFERQRDKPTLKTKIKMGLNRAYQAIGNFESGVLVVRTLFLVGGLLASIFTGMVVPFLICAAVAGVVMGGLALAEYALKRKKEHREEFQKTLDDRTDWLEIKENELDIVINKLECNKKAAEEETKAAEKKNNAPPAVEKKLEVIPEQTQVLAFKQNIEKNSQQKIYNGNQNKLLMYKDIKSDNVGETHTVQGKVVGEPVTIQRKILNP